MVRIGIIIASLAVILTALQIASEYDKRHCAEKGGHWVIIVKPDIGYCFPTKGRRA